MISTITNGSTAGLEQALVRLHLRPPCHLGVEGETLKTQTRWMDGAQRRQRTEGLLVVEVEATGRGVGIRLGEETSRAIRSESVHLCWQFWIVDARQMVEEKVGRLVRAAVVDER